MMPAHEELKSNLWIRCACTDWTG